MTSRRVVRRRPTLPQQKRSQQTRERLVCAGEELLRTRAFDEITVEQIVERAHASSATFYKHFPRKQDLLPLFLARLRAAAEMGIPMSRRPEGQGATLATRVAWIVRHVATTTTLRRNVLRACMAARYLKDPALGPELLNRLREEIRDTHRWLLE
jgi:AcrR family transcriptional regulator